MVQRGKRSGGEGWTLIRPCPTCGRPEPGCFCADETPPPKPPGKQRPRFRLEKRRGKPVTVITHLTLDDADLKALGKRLRTRLGTGGTERDGLVELQGDHREALPALLAQFGFKA